MMGSSRVGLIVSVAVVALAWAASPAVGTRVILQNSVTNNVDFFFNGEELDIDIEELTDEEAEEKISEIRAEIEARLAEARARVDAALNDVNNKVDGALDDIDVDGRVDDALAEVDDKVGDALEKVKNAVEDAKNRVDEALEDVDSKIDAALSNANDRIDEALSAVQDLEYLSPENIQEDVQNLIRERLSKFSDLKERIQQFFNRP
eukprot:scaffold333550_cov37-Prasinocladus_malaysianus.AAC.1